MRKFNKVRVSIYLEKMNTNLKLGIAKSNLKSPGVKEKYQ